MKLPTSLLPKKKDNVKYFLALLISDDKVKALILEQEDNILLKVTQHEEQSDTSIDNLSLEELIDIFDKTISIAESKLPKDANLEKTIFSVKDEWTQDGKIKKEILAKLKKVCDELVLSPIGFLIFPEAISHLLTSEEGAPISGIFAHISKNNISVSLLRGGKIIETRKAPLDTFNTPQIVDMILRHFTDYEVLPSRIIVQNDNNPQNQVEINEKLGQEFINHNWSKSLPFLHVPQVTVLPVGFDIKAVEFGAATQMGLEIAKKDIGEKVPIISKSEEDQSNIDISSLEEINDFGFSNQDVAINKKINSEQNNQADQLDKPTEKDYEALEENEIEENKTKALPQQAMLIFSSITKYYKKIPFSKIPTFKGSSFLGKSKTFLLIPLIILLLIIYLVVYFFIVKTKVELTLKPQTTNITSSVTFATDSSNDFQNAVIAAQSVSTDESSSATQNATGKKSVGDKAKGTVTIYNGTSDTKQYDAGTVVTSSNGLKFTLDNSVTISSASGDVISGIKSGTSDVNVTASDIGPSYNLPSNTQFNVGSEALSSVEAKNGNAFSGGTQKEVTVVSQSDVQNALSSLEKNIQGQANNDLSKKISKDQLLLSDLINKTIKNKTASKKVGDQASSFTLSADVSISTLAYNKQDLENLAQKLLSSKIASDQTIDPNSISIKINNSSQTSNGAKADLIIESKLFPKINSKSIATQIEGKSFSQAQNMILSNSQVSSAKLTLSPNLPIFPAYISHFVGNINIIIHDE